MKSPRIWLLLLGTLGVAVTWWYGEGQADPPPAAPAAAAPAAPAAQAGVNVQARGPVHEAYANPVNGDAPKPAGTVPQEPPANIEEIPAEQKPQGDNMQWIPGYWAFDGERKSYLWVSGFWRAPPPGRQWVPGHWDKAGDAWQWVPGFWQTHQQQEVNYLPEPPKAVAAAPSVPQPGPEATYVPGCWVWRVWHYVWRPGYWVVYRPNWVWVPAHYAWTPAGYVFVEGYWDYTLRDRGLLFAPVVVDVEVYRRPGYVYRPAFVITDDSMYGALFVQPAYGCYYYGDYFTVGYQRCGFVAWHEYTYCGGFGYDPLFCYYRTCYRNDPTWSIELRACYVGRYNGTIAAPSRTIVNNTTIINNNTTVINNTNVNNTTINNNTNINKTVVNNRFASASAAPAQSLSQVNTSAYKLQPVSAAQAATHQQAARQLQQLSTQRSQQERQLVSQRPAGSGIPTKPQVAKLNLPSSPASAAPTGAKAPPSAPVHAETPAHLQSPTTTPGGQHPGTTTPGTTTPGAHPGTTTPGTTTPGAHPGTTTPGTTTPGAHPGTTTPGTSTTTPHTTTPGTTSTTTPHTTTPGTTTPGTTPHTTTPGTTTPGTTTPGTTPGTTTPGTKPGTTTTPPAKRPPPPPARPVSRPTNDKNKKQN
jgi:hypothetical protein